MFSFKESISPIRIIFFLSILVLGALSWYSYSNNQKLIKKAELVNHTNVVRFELQNAESSIKDAETGSRAYLLTGDSSYLKAYYQAQKNVPQNLITLDSLTNDNPLQVKNMQRLKKLSAEKFSDIESSLSAGPKAVTPEMLAESKTDIEEINAHINLMMYVEQRLLTERTGELTDAVSFTPKSNIILAGFSILLLVFSYFKILHELEKSKALQKKISDTNFILEKSNGELAQFAYVASHDLQEPLRKIQTFISRINDTETTLSPKSKDYFNRVDNSAKRMQQLIRDILSYSRVDNRDSKFEQTDLNEVIEAVKYQLEEFIKEKNVVVNAEKLPVINAVKYQLEQLFQNLISNSIKFARPDVPPVINISADAVSGSSLNYPSAQKNINYTRIRFADNGIGFDQQYEDRIFNIFQRLNNREAYEGNGIGLSIVKKISEAHGGFVIASGESGGGAVFAVYIPV